MPDTLAALLKNVVAKATPAPAPLPMAPASDPLKSYLAGVMQKGAVAQQGLTAKSPFLSSALGEAGSFIHNAASSLDTSIAGGARNVRDALTGKLGATPDDYATGAYKTVLGIGKLAQGFNQGIVQLAKSAASAVSPDQTKRTFDSPGLRAFLGSAAGAEGAEAPTLQEIYTKGVEHAKTLGATPTQAATYGGAIALGTGLMDNPFFGPEKAALNLTEEAVKDLAKVATHDEAVQILVKNGIPEEVAQTVAPVFVNADTPKLVRTAAREVANGVDNARAIRNGKLTERGFITSVKEQIPELETRIAGQYIPRETDPLAIKAANLIKDDIDRAERERLGTDDKAVAISAELIKHYSREAEAATDQATKNALYDKAAAVANDTARNLTEAGRTVQAASILGRLTPEGQVRFAAREIQKYNEGVPTSKKIPELTGDQIEKITKKVQEAADLPDGVEKAKAFKEAQDYIASLVPTPLMKKAISVWKAGLLTGFKTSMLNTAANLFHGISEIAKDVPAVAVDSVASLFTGKRTSALTLKGLTGGSAEGFKKGFDYLKTGFDERQAAGKLGMGKINFGDGWFAKLVQKYEQSVFRVIGAEDMPFYYGAKAHSIAEQAIVSAKNEGLKGADAKAYAEHLTQNPTDEMIRNATADAEIAVFQNSTQLGKLAKGIQDLGGGAGEIVVPFGRTPAAVAMQLVNYSPVGVVSEIAKEIKAGKFDQRAFSKAVGRGVVGTGALYLGSELYKNGKIALGYPTKESDREQWKLEGKQPNSIKIDNEWRQVGLMGTLGISLIIGGYIANGMESSGSFFGGLQQAALGTLTTLTQQTFLQGLNSFIDAVTDPERSAQSFFSGILSSLIPTIIGDVATATDPLQRDTTSGGIADRAIAKLPGARETLQPKVDALGNKLPDQGFFTVMLDPSRPTNASTDSTVRELSRLQQEGHSVTPGVLGNKSGYAFISKEENTKLRVRAGQIVKGKLDNLFQSQEYQAMDDDQKEKTIDSFVEKARNAARAEMVLHKTKDLSGDEYAKELAKLKASGLMTKSVFELYQEIR